MDRHSRTILVTGGAGFIGSHVVETLAQDPSVRVLSLDNYFTGSRSNEFRSGNVTYLYGHTKDIARRLPVRPDLVYHLGEYARVERSFQEPDLVWDLNVAGTAAVLEYCRRETVPIVYAGSSTKFSEGEGPNICPYAWAKAVNTELVQNYGRWYALTFAIAYFFNVYGPREIAEGDYATVIGIFARHRRERRPLRVTAPGTQRRNFTHVRDVVRGLIMIGEKPDGREYHFGHPRSYSIVEVAELFGGPIALGPEVSGNRRDATLDLSNAMSMGWKPEHELQDYIDGITRTTSAQSR